MKNIDIKNNYELGRKMADKISKFDNAEYENLVNRLAIYDQMIRYTLDHPLASQTTLRKHQDGLKLLRLWDKSKKHEDNVHIEAHFRHWAYRILTVYYNEELSDEQKANILTKVYGGIVAPFKKKLILGWCKDALNEVNVSLERIEGARLTK